MPTVTFYQLRCTVSAWKPEQLPADAPLPRPSRLTARYLTAPHWWRTYICSLTPSLRLDFFEYDFEWADGDEPSDACVEWYSSHGFDLATDAERTEYHDWYRVCAGTFDTPEAKMTFAPGWEVSSPRTYESEEDEDDETFDARVYEAEQGNYGV